MHDAREMKYLIYSASMTQQPDQWKGVNLAKKGVEISIPLIFRRKLQSSVLSKIDHLGRLNLNFHFFKQHGRKHGQVHNYITMHRFNLKCFKTTPSLWIL